MQCKSKAWMILIYVFLTVCAFVTVFPILWVVFSSFKPAGELFNWPPTLLPQSPTLENYINALSKGNFLQYFQNTFFVTVLATLLTIVVNLMSGYVFAKYNFKGRNFLFALVLMTMMIPLEVIMIPVFKVIVGTHMYDNLWGLIIPAVASPTAVFLIRQYYIGIPSDYMEAGRIDGASELGIFLRIMAPMAYPVLSVLCIFSFMWRWNDYLWPKIVISSKSNYTIQLALATFSGEYSVDWDSLLAMSVITMIPVLIIFLIFQKHIVGGITIGGVKG